MRYEPSRGRRCSPQRSSSTIGLGLGLVGSAFTIFNAYLFRPVDLPNPRALYMLIWETEGGLRRQRFRLMDYEALQPEARRLAELAATQNVVVQGGGRHDPGAARDRQLLRDARRAAGARPVAAARRCSGARRESRRRADTQRLAIPPWCGSSHCRATHSARTSTFRGGRGHAASTPTWQARRR